ncbi:retroviral-like aspartic protease 1 [Rhizophagus clarus]|uniref:Pro-Pol polyprotein n=1 Tax=Rhizophagus clarus TaxID=94130 RepID=A0A8H3QHE2_9GLOM|nr:retroviral-like aspartic protease 1 [Rhizophagus clarus]
MASPQNSDKKVPAKRPDGTTSFITNQTKGKSPDTADANIVPNLTLRTLNANKKYIDQVKSHHQQHQQHNINQTALPEEIIKQYPDPTCRVCYPEPKKNMLSVEFRNFWFDWFRSLYSVSHYNGHTVYLFDEAVKEKDQDKRINLLQHMVFTIRYKNMPAEGLENVVADIAQTWDTTAGFVRMERLIKQPSDPNNDDGDQKDDDDEEVVSRHGQSGINEDDDDSDDYVLRIPDSSEPTQEIPKLTEPEQERLDRNLQHFKLTTLESSINDALRNIVKTEPLEIKSAPNSPIPKSSFNNAYVPVTNVNTHATIIPEYSVRTFSWKDKTTNVGIGHANAQYVNRIGAFFNNEINELKDNKIEGGYNLIINDTLFEQIKEGDSGPIKFNNTLPSYMTTITNPSISTAKTVRPDVTIRNPTIGNINLGGSSSGSSKVQGTTQVKFKSPVKKSIPTGNFSATQPFLDINPALTTNPNIVAVPLSGGNLHNITTSNVSSQNTQPAYPIIQLAPTDNADLLTQLLQEFNQILSANQHHSSPTSNIRKESRLVDFPKFKGGNQDPIEWLEAFDRACKANCVSMDRRMDVVPSYLKGTALIWFNTVGAREWENSLNRNQSFTHLFEAQFCNPFKMSQWKHQLRNRKQRAGETIDEYTSAMEELWKRIDPKRKRTELDRISEYVEGLRPEFIVPVQSAMPQTGHIARECWNKNKDQSNRPNNRGNNRNNNNNSNVNHYNYQSNSRQEEIATTQDSENEKQLNSRIDYNTKDVKDALFGEAVVFGERINVIIDSGSKGSVISKQFLDRKQQDIDSPAHFRLIDIQGNRTCPLGIKHNVQVNIEGYDVGIDMVVTESKDYNIVLGNDWISKVCATLDYNNGLLTILTPHGTVTTAVTCWDNIKNPLQFHPIPQVSIENPSELELEGEDENVESQTFFFNVQQTSNITQIEGDVYPNECLQYWIKKFRSNDQKQWKGPGKCWCEKKLKEQQQCKVCYKRWEDCALYSMISPTDDPFYKVQLEQDDVLLYITSEKSIAIGEINNTQKEKLTTLLQKYAHLFATKKEELGRTNIVKHSIYTENIPPIRQKFYRTSQKEQEHIDKEIKEMLYYNIIRPSTSEWASPVILVPKKNGKLRFCVDYRQLNKVTKKDNYPLPRTDEIFDSLGKAQWFTSLDLASGYWQVEMKEEDKSKTAFITRNGMYEFNVMPFGLCNAPGTFQRCMDNILKDMLWKNTMVYLDDVNIYSKTFEEHLQHLEEVLKRVEKAGLKINPEKCHFCTQSLQFLGHIVTNKGILPDPSKVDAIKNYPVPKNLTQLRAFLGLASYYRRFIKDFSKISTPLYMLLKKDIPYEWNQDRHQVFQFLKEKLITAPLLAYPDFTKSFLLFTDASITALGAVLEQEQEDGLRHPIAYASRSTSESERNYFSTELECAAVIWAVNYFRPYLYGKKFTIFTDHSALQWLLKLKTIKNGLTGRLARWQLILQPYDYDIKYRKEQLYYDLYQYLSNLIIPEKYNKNQQDKIKQLAKNYTIQNDKLFRKNQDKLQRVITPSQVEIILFNLHKDMTGAHLGVETTYNKIKERYYWPKMYNDIKIYIESCDNCQRREIISRHGVPKEILSDHGTSFNNALINEICDKYQTKHRLTSAYRPQTNGMVERFNRTIGESDKVLVEQTHLRNNMSAKLENQWIGPYYIHNVLDQNVYKLRHMNGKLVKGVIHGNRLKIYIEQYLEPLILLE